MKLLFDENLSHKLVPQLLDLFPNSTHVASEGLLTSPDIDVWNYAKAHGFIIVTADADFYELATTLGAPPKVVWLRGCDYPTRTAAHLIRSQAIRLTEFASDEDRAILIINP